MYNVFPPRVLYLFLDRFHCGVPLLGCHKMLFVVKFGVDLRSKKKGGYQKGEQTKANQEFTHSRQDIADYPVYVRFV